MSLSPAVLVSAWRLQDAKTQFSALVDNAMRGIPQHITRRGKKAVVVLSEDDFAALQRKAHQQPTPRTLVEHLLAMPKESNPQAAHHTPLELQPRDVDFS